MTAWPSFDVTISLFSQSVQKYYNNFACARFYFERIGNKCFHRGESRGIDLLPYKEERYISSFWNEKTRITLSSSPVFCYAKYRGGVRRTEGLENTDSGGDRVRSPLPLLVTDEIGGVPAGRGGKEIPAEETETDTNLWGPRKKYKERVQSIAIPRKNALCRVGWKLFELLFLLSLYLCYLCSRKLLGSVRAQYVKHERFFFHTPAICAPL